MRLPEGAYRSTAQDDIEALRQALMATAQTNHGKIDSVEVLVWSGAANPMSKLPGFLKQAGYSYVNRTAFQAEPGKITPIAAVRKDKKNDLLGMWIETPNKMTMLVWGIYRPDNAEKPDTPVDGLTVSQPEEPAPAQEPAKEVIPQPQPKPNVPTVSTGDPGSLQGEWTWTTISSVNHVNKTTGALAEPSGMSAKFTFLPNGRYKMFFFVRQRTYNLVSQATTTEEGKVTFGKGTFVLNPTRGHYKGYTGSRVIDRPMSLSDLKSKTYHWEWRIENGKRQLYMGPTQQSMSPFKRP